MQAENKLLDKNYLQKAFIEKLKNEHKIPTARAIEKDYRFPHYQQFRKIFGNQRIREIEVFKERIDKFKLLFEIEENFCEDCLYDKETCGCKIEACKHKASVYFKNYEVIK